MFSVSLIVTLGMTLIVYVPLLLKVVLFWYIEASGLLFRSS